MRRFLLVLAGAALLLFPILLPAQSRQNVLATSKGAVTVTGKVTDKQGNPLPGANIIISDLDLGAATNTQGNYRFTVPPKYVKGQTVEITARFIGYHSLTKKIKLSPGSVKVDFALALDVLNMDAVVVTGVSESTPKKLLPFSVSRVSEEQIQKVPEQNPLRSIQGKVSGVEVVQGTGTPGSGADIKIRGAVNIGTNNAPMIIVDGVILDASSQVDIDALDIQDIEVVKGAAAAAIYGSRAANGVINIRTKRGSNLSLGATKILARSEAGFDQFPFTANDYRSAHHEFKLTPDGKYFVDKDGNPLTGDPWEAYRRAVLDNSNVKRCFQDNPYPIPTYDQVKQFFRPGRFVRNYFEISRRVPTGNIMLSYGILHEPGVIDGVTGYRRSNVRLNMDQKMRENLKLGMSTYYMRSWRDNPQGSINPFYSLMFMSPMANLKAPNPDGTPYRIDPDPKSLEENPLYASHNQDLDFNRRGLVSDFNLSWNPMTWLSIQGHMGYNRATRFNTYYYFKGFKSIDMQNYPTGHYERRHYISESMNTDVTARIFRDFGNLSTKNTLRYHSEKYDYEYTRAQGDNLAVNGVRRLNIVDPDQDYVASYTSKIRSVGYYWESAFNYSEKYLANFLLRYDGSSLFGPEQRYHLYYRAGLGWRLSQEPWWFTDKITEFKLRAAYGTAGSRPGFEDQYETFNVTGGSITKNRLGNKKLKPAFSKELELGVEMAFLDRISFETSYSHRVTDDQILTVPLPSFFGYTSQVQNAGTLVATSLEASINARLIERKDLGWNFSLNFSRVRETITKLGPPPWRTGPYNAFYVREGEENGAMYGYRWLENTKDLNDLAQANGVTYDPKAFQVNDDGYLVPVGNGNTWQSGPGADGKVGTDDDLWGTKVVVGTDANGNPIKMDFGMPVKYKYLEGDQVKSFVKIGHVLPDFISNFSSTLRWKGFTFYALFSAVVGGDIYNGTRQWSYRELRHKNVDQYGKPEGKKKPIAYYSKLYDTNKTNKEFVENGTYLKLRELSIYYRFNRNALLSFAGGYLGQVFQGLTLGFIGRNVFTLTGYSGFDPEVGNAEYRVDNFVYPHFRQFTFYVQVEL